MKENLATRKRWNSEAAMARGDLRRFADIQLGRLIESMEFNDIDQDSRSFNFADGSRICIFHSHGLSTADIYVPGVSAPEVLPELKEEPIYPVFIAIIDFDGVKKDVVIFFRDSGAVITEIIEVPERPYTLGVADSYNLEVSGTKEAGELVETILRVISTDQSLYTTTDRCRSVIEPHVEIDKSAYPGAQPAIRDIQDQGLIRCLWNSRNNLFVHDLKFNADTGILDVDRVASYVPDDPPDNVQYQETPIMFTFNNQHGDPISFFTSVSDTEVEMWCGVIHQFDFYKNIRWSKLKFDIVNDGDGKSTEELEYFPAKLDFTIPGDSGDTKSVDIDMDVLVLGSAGLLESTYNILNHSKSRKFISDADTVLSLPPERHDEVYWWETTVSSDIVDEIIIEQIFNPMFFIDDLFKNTINSVYQLQHSDNSYWHYEGSTYPDCIFSERLHHAKLTFAQTKRDMFSMQPVIKSGSCWDMSELISHETYGFYFDEFLLPDPGGDVSSPVLLVDSTDVSTGVFDFDLDETLVTVAIIVEPPDYYAPQSDASFVQNEFKPLTDFDHIYDPNDWPTETAVGTVLPEALPGAGESLGVTPTCVKNEMWCPPRGRIDNPCFVIFDPVFGSRRVANGDISTYHRLDNRACPQPGQDNGVLHAYKILGQEGWVILFNNVDKSVLVESALATIGVGLPDIDSFYML